MKIALVQITSTLDPGDNLDKIRSFIPQIKEQNCQAVFLPEVFYSMSDATKPTPHLVRNGNEHFHEIQKLVKDLGCYVLGGTVAYDDDGIVRNRCLNFNSDGELIAEYDKVHLFSCDLSKHSSKQVLDENDIYSPGKEMNTLEFDGWKMGLSICFDLRFPEVYRLFFKEGCQLATVSSAFTKTTGKAHWHTLCRARAIENQMYIVASNQWGIHNEKISTFGHSLVIDPWGDTLADAGEGEKVVFAEIKQKRVADIRLRMDMQPRL